MCFNINSLKLGNSHKVYQEKSDVREYEIIHTRVPTNQRNVASKCDSDFPLP